MKIDEDEKTKKQKNKFAQDGSNRKQCIDKANEYFYFYYD